MSAVILPAIKGRMGDWEYYVTVMKMGILSNEMNFAHELHPHAELDRMIQRELSDRSEEMKDYLLRQPQRFYGAIVAAVYGGNPQFYPVQLAEHRLIDDIEQGFGVLKFDGSQRYFALDGQHRLSSIKLAIKEKPDLASEEVTVIFVPHKTDAVGEARTRRLFTTLNRYAKPVSKKDSIVMDEDDAIAVVTRRLIREFKLFEGPKIIISDSKAIPPTNKNSFTNLLTLYECNEIILNTPVRIVDRTYKQIARSNEELDQMYQEAYLYWETLANKIPEIKKVLEAPRGEKSITDARKKEGGNLLFRPIGQIAIAFTIRNGLNKGFSLEDLITKLASTPLELSSAPWLGVIWHQGNQRILVGKEVTNAAIKILEYYLGIEDDLSEVNKIYTAALNSSGLEGVHSLPLRGF